LTFEHVVCVLFITHTRARLLSFWQPCHAEAGVKYTVKYKLDKIQRYTVKHERKSSYM